MTKGTSGPNAYDDSTGYHQEEPPVPSATNGTPLIAPAAAAPTQHLHDNTFLSMQKPAWQEHAPRSSSSNRSSNRCSRYDIGDGDSGGDDVGGGGNVRFLVYLLSLQSLHPFCTIRGSFDVELTFTNLSFHL